MVANPLRDADALIGQLLEHLAERGVLTADERHVVDAELLEEADVRGHTHGQILQWRFYVVARADQLVPVSSGRGRNVAETAATDGVGGSEQCGSQIRSNRGQPRQAPGPSRS